jgi:succinoglycan biosynthesis transport protein ExoP
MSAKVPHPPKAPTISPYSILRSLGKHLGLIAAITVVGGILTFFVVKFIPPVYSAEATVLVESQRIPENYVAATVHENLEARLNALRQEILSYSRLVDVIKKFNLYRSERANRSMEEVIERMRDDLSIKVQRGMIPGRPGAFTVTYRGEDPNTVPQVTNLIATFFIDENLRTREVAAVGTSEFLDAQLADAKKRLEEQEQQLSVYKLRYSGELPQQENALISSLAQAQTQLTGLHDSLNRIQQNKMMAQSSLEGAEAEHNMLQRLATSSAASATTSSSTPSLPIATPAPLRESDRLQQVYDSVRARYSETHPDAKRAAIALARAREMEAKEPASTADPLVGIQSSSRSEAPVRAAAIAANARTVETARATNERVLTLRAQLAGWDRQITTVEQEREKLVAQIANMQQRISHLPLREQELAGVMRDYENTRTNYRSLLDKKMAADVAANMERRQKAERFVMLEMARKPEVPIKPKKFLLYGAGTVLCLLLGMATAIGVETKKGMLLGEWELPPGVVVLGRVPAIVATKQVSPIKRWKSLVWATVPVGCTVCLIAAGVYKGWLKL